MTCTMSSEFRPSVEMVFEIHPSPGHGTPRANHSGRRKARYYTRLARNLPSPQCPYFAIKSAHPPTASAPRCPIDSGPTASDHHAKQRRRNTTVPATSGSELITITPHAEAAGFGPAACVSYGPISTTALTIRGAPSRSVAIAGGSAVAGVDVWRAGRQAIVSRGGCGHSLWHRRPGTCGRAGFTRRNRARRRVEPALPLACHNRWSHPPRPG